MFKKMFGFSLIELLVSMIIISLLVSAFMPLITKKMKASNIIVGSNISNIGQFQDTNYVCPNNYHGYNGLCFPDLENCLTYEGANCTSCLKDYHVENGKCISDCQCENGSCEEGKNYCTSCNDGYSFYNNTCVEGKINQCYDYHCAICKSATEGTCTACKQGYVLKDGQCYFGTLKGCINPTYDSTYHRIDCESCESEYTKCHSGSCKLTSEVTNGTCPANTMKIGCICVAKYNIGDGYYGENWLGVQPCNGNGAGCYVENGTSNSATAYNLQATCWKGDYTANPSHCNGNYGGYSGCFRTLCNWLGADRLCSNIGWRLPNMAELETFASINYSSKTIAGNGLMLCDVSYTNTTASMCTVLFGGCKGCWDSDCRAHHLWSSSFSSMYLAYDKALEEAVGWSLFAHHLGPAFSARCVKDL